MSLPALSLASHFARLKDPRLKRRQRHEFLDIVVLAIAAVIGGANTWADIALFGRCHQDWFKTFLALPNGIPSHDTFERLFARINPQAFLHGFQQWIAALVEQLGIRHVAIDGKTLRRSGDRAAGLGPLHLVSAWATQQNLSLGQVAVDQKSNEITAIPALLKLLELKGTLVTIDAMGCQKAIARQIVAQGGDYVLTVKENQPQLFQQVSDLFTQAIDTDFAGLDWDEYGTQSCGHGRQERRTYWVLRDVDRLACQEAWAGLAAVGMCVSVRSVRGEESLEIRYFIGSKKASARVYGQAFRKHWCIENNLHWQVDVSFGEDQSRVRQRTSAENLAVLRRIALSLLKQHPSKGSINSKRHRAGWDVTFLEEILRGASKVEKV